MLRSQTMKTTKPRFKHDCDSCDFLGQYNGYDLYFCARADSSMGGSVIARYGNDGSNYASSGMSVASSYKLSSETLQQDGLEHIRALRVAMLIAFDMGLAGKYRDNHARGYRVLRFANPVPNKNQMLSWSAIIDNERRAYENAYSVDDGVYAEIVQVIASNADDF